LNKKEGIWHTPKFFNRLNCKSKGVKIKRIKSWGTLPGLEHFKGKGVCWSYGMGTRMSDKWVNYSHEPAQCHNPTLKECEDDTHTPEMGTWESFGTPKNLELDCRSQNTLPWGTLYTARKVLKCGCRKWPHMNHLDICSASYVWKKGRELNW
jgi:hypothetical protein